MAEKYAPNVRVGDAYTAWTTESDSALWADRWRPMAELVAKYQRSRGAIAQRIDKLGRAYGEAEALRHYLRGTARAPRSLPGSRHE